MEGEGCGSRGWQGGETQRTRSAQRMSRSASQKHGQHRRHACEKVTGWGGWGVVLGAQPEGKEARGRMDGTNEGR